MTEEVHLPEAVLRVDVALGEEEVVFGGGVDVGDSVVAAVDVDFAVEASEVKEALGTGEGPCDQPASGQAEGEQGQGQRKKDDSDCASSPLVHPWQPPVV